MRSFNNSGCAVRSFKASWDRFIAADLHRESSYDAVQDEVLISFCSKGLQYCTVFCCTSDICTSRKQYAELLLSASRGEKVKKMVLEFVRCCAVRLNRTEPHRTARKNRTVKSQSFWREKAAWLGASCGIGRCLGSFLLFWVAMHCGKL